MSTKGSKFHRSSLMPKGSMKYANLTRPLSNAYSSVHVKNFRQLVDVSLESLGQINILVGKNNAGKTSMLEALFFHACGYNSNNAISNILSRRQQLGATSSRFDWGERLLSCFNNKVERPLKFAVSAKFRERARPAVVESSYVPTEEIAALRPFSFPEAVAGHGLSYAKARWGDKADTTTAEDDAEDDLFLPNRAYIGDWLTSIDGNKKVARVYAPLAQTKLRSPLHHAKWHTKDDYLTPEAPRIIYGELKRHGLLERMSSTLSRVFGSDFMLDSYPFPDGGQGPVYAVPRKWSLTGGASSTGNSDANVRGALPLYAYGEGVQRLLYLLGQMVVYPEAAHLIEDAESGLHYSMQAMMAEQLIEFAREFSTQVFITTHSAEFLDAFLGAVYGPDARVEGVASRQSEIMVYKLRRASDGKQEAWPMTGREAYDTRETFRIELR